MSTFESGARLAGSPETTVERHLQAWLEQIGLAFSPFFFTESSHDPWLNSYLVGLEAFAVAWGDWPALVFAPPGGGKTALRVRAYHACWIGQETNRPFPIPYEIPFLDWGHARPDINDYLASLSERTAQTLLLSLIYRPHWFLNLPTAAKRRLTAALAHNLPAPFALYQGPWEETRDLSAVCAPFPPAFLPPDPVPEAEVERLFKGLAEAQPVKFDELTPAARWQQLVGVLQEDLEFPSIYVLFDSLDGAPDTLEDPQAATNCLGPLFSMIPEWSLKQVYLKGFLPLELDPLLGNGYPGAYRLCRRVTLDWTPDLLAEVIRKRVYFASQGTFGSLGPLCVPGIQDLETVLAREVKPLPREIIVLTRYVLEAHVRDHRERPKIDRTDIEFALNRYREEQKLLEKPADI